MKPHFFISLFFNEDGFHYCATNNRKEIMNTTSYKSEEKNLTQLLLNLKKPLTKPWSSIYLTAILPIEKIIIKHFYQPESLSKNEIPMFIKEKLKEIFHDSQDYYFDFELIKTDQQTTIKTYITPNSYWQHFIYPIKEAGINSVVAETETVSLYRYLYLHTKQNLRHLSVYISKNKIYLLYNQEIKIISCHDNYWLEKSSQLIFQQEASCILVFHSPENKANIMKNLLLEIILRHNTETKSIQLPNDYHPFCLGGLMRFSHA